MSDWSHGYNVSLGYTYGFYRELAPDWLDLCTRISGYAAPSRSTDGSFRYIEFGSGQGLGLCLLAAANPVSSRPRAKRSIGSPSGDTTCTVPSGPARSQQSGRPGSAGP